MNQSYTKAEREHLAAIKALPCSVCDHPAPSDAHHIRQDSAWLCAALCRDCHQGGFNGWHGQRAIWKVMKLDEVDALGITIKRLMKGL